MGKNAKYWLNSVNLLLGYKKVGTPDIGIIRKVRCLLTGEKKYDRQIGNTP
jgi:hypothetical protein